jgi:hypothetical protein
MKQVNPGSQGLRVPAIGLGCNNSRKSRGSTRALPGFDLFRVKFRKIKLMDRLEDYV